MTTGLANSCPRASGVLEIALVNNMPDQALAATEAQFAELVRQASGGERRIRWVSYTLPGLPRSEVARRYLERTHQPIEALYSRGADALIVTGSEPLALRLEDEPYWTPLTQLVEWARRHTLSAIWSCLAAHAAVLHLDGIERQRAPQKLSGVFRCDVMPNGLFAHLPRRVISTPHSRYNGLARDDLLRGGYQISSYSQEAGVNIFWRREPSLFVFFQGHPEYEADTLLKEYRRDAFRFFEGSRPDYPDQPINYFSDKTAQKLESLRQRARLDAAVERIQELTQILSQASCRSAWQEDTADIFRAWLEVVRQERVRAQRA